MNIELRYQYYIANELISNNIDLNDSKWEFILEFTMIYK